MSPEEARSIALRERFTYKEIIALQKLPLADKELIACAVIAEALDKTRHTAAIAFSGGKDSQVVAHLIERNFPVRFGSVHCIFGNTGIEFPESLHFAREYGKAHFGDRFHETELGRLEEDELKYEFARQIVAELEEEDALDEILKPDGKLKGQKALIKAAEKRGYMLDRSNCYFKGDRMTFAYCVRQYGAPLLGKAASKLDAHRINIECFLRYSQTDTDSDKLRQYYDVLRCCKFSQHCCKLLKKEPSERLQAQLGVDVIFKGLMASESHTRMTSIATRGMIYAGKRPHIKDGPFRHVSPIGMWTDADVWEYIRKYQLPYSPLYDITYTAEDGTVQHIKRNGCIMCGTDIQFGDNHLAILRQTHPKAWRCCMERFGYADQLAELYRIKKNTAILAAYSENGTRARMLERYGAQTARLLDNRPCVFDDFGEMVEIEGTWMSAEYDPEEVTAS